MGSRIRYLSSKKKIGEYKGNRYHWVLVPFLFFGGDDCAICAKSHVSGVRNRTNVRNRTVIRNWGCLCK